MSKKFKCDFTGCGKIYRHKKSLNDHKLSHGNANLKCDFFGCDYKTYNKKYLREHQMRHSEEKRDSHSIRHLELNPDSKELECNEIGCNYRTQILRNFKKHKNAHNLILSCGFCEFKFLYTQESDLMFVQLIIALKDMLRKEVFSVIKEHNIIKI